MMRNRLLLCALFLAAGCGPAGAPSPAGPGSLEGTGLAPASPPAPAASTPAPAAPREVAPLTRADLPQVLFSQPDALLAARAEGLSGNVSSPALARLRADAEQALSAGPFTVMHKTQVPPSGDPHDYMSLARYWWPNPKTEDGLPYVVVDGQVNPETETIPDKAELQQLLPTVSTLSHAAFVFGDERYAEHAAFLLRTWFLDPATRMNPNLEYSQIHKGHPELPGGSGIIDARDFGILVESVGLLAHSQAWTPGDDAALRDWFSQYLDWLLNSAGGKDEEKSPNNHYTFYWYQALPLAIYTGQDALVDQAFARLTRVLDAQIKPDGSQPLELKRTKPFSYSLFNLMAWSRLAMMAEARGVDLWNHEGQGGTGSLRKAFAYLLPYATGEKALVDDPANPYGVSDFARTLNRAAQPLNQPSWHEQARSLMGSQGELLDLDLLVPPQTR